MDLWICGFVDLWICGFVDLLICGFVDLLICGFVDLTINELISKRMVKKRQMRWTKKGAHLLLQAQVKILNNDFKDHFYE